MELQWTTSVPASALSAIRAIFEGRSLAVAELRKALEPAAEMFRDAAEECHCKPEQLLDHVIPLATDTVSAREMARTAIAKACGHNYPADSIDCVAKAIDQVIDDFCHAFPQAADELTLRVEPLRMQWEARGPGLLVAIERVVEPNLLVPSARVVLVQPVLGGGGTAYVPYNQVSIEAVLANPIAELPEVLRLGWLLSQVNFDLPAYSDLIYRDRLKMVGALGMIPAVLTAAEDVELARVDEQTVRLACNTWFGNSDNADSLSAWWETYRATQPTWAVALAALDKMLN